MDKEFYNKDYYERGPETGKSCYRNYHWLPEFTIPMAMTFVDFLHIAPEHTILDFGCAKGYLVKAFRWLNRQAWGMDISPYAIAKVDSEVKGYCALVDQFNDKIDGFDFIIAKDVFEHIPQIPLRVRLQGMKAGKLFAVIPLGKNGKYYAKANNCDLSHIICETEEWWFKFFYEAGWKVDDFRFYLKGCKDSYYETCPNAHGFFTLTRV